jgi:CBS domain-containing protein
MRTPSLRIGVLFGVEIRLHVLWILFLFFSMTYAAFTGATALRGFALWFLMLVAVMVREVARSIAFAASGARLSSLLVLPAGAVPSFSSGSKKEAQESHLVALAGPLANFFVGITLALLLYMATNQVNLFERPWVTPAYLLRSLIWTQVLLGGLHLIPAAPLDAGVTLRQRFARIRGSARGARAMAGISQTVSMGLVIAGISMQNVWLMVMGAFLMVGAQMEAATAVGSETSAGDSVLMRDVMLTDFTTISSADTLEMAMDRSVHSLQDIFPVVRGSLLVGTVSRQTLSDALSQGNGYVQGVMARTFPVAAAEDSLSATLLRIGGGGTQMVPIVERNTSDNGEGDRVLGIVTPQSLSLAMHLLGRSRRLVERAARTDKRDQ